MAICVYFPIETMTPGTYDEVQRRLEAAGQAAPAGRSYHVAFRATRLHVVDVWESQEPFDAFGPTLMPILGELGVDPGEPADRRGRERHRRLVEQSLREARPRSSWRPRRPRRSGWHGPSRAALAVDSRGNALVTWTEGGARQSVVIPPAGMLTHSSSLPGAATSRGPCARRFRSHVAVRRTPDGRLWALQSFPAGAGKPPELHFARWSGAPTRVTLALDGTD